MANFGWVGHDSKDERREERKSISGKIKQNFSWRRHSNTIGRNMSFVWMCVFAWKLMYL